MMNTSRYRRHTGTATCVSPADRTFQFREQHAQPHGKSESSWNCGAVLSPTSQQNNLRVPQKRWCSSRGSLRLQPMMTKVIIWYHATALSWSGRLACCGNLIFANCSWYRPPPPTITNPLAAAGPSTGSESLSFQFFDTLHSHPPPCCAPPSPGLRGARLPSSHRPRHAQRCPELPQ
jgi:hypothetical protein